MQYLLFFPHVLLSPFLTALFNYFLMHFQEKEDTASDICLQKPLK